MFQDTTQHQPVTVLGKTFNSDEERRNYFREELRKHLPELKKIEGYPIGEDEDILNLSDPPFYTACPNPWLNDFIAEWEDEKRLLEENGKRTSNFKVTEPYSNDIHEGKNHPIYMYHSYHTKVPHQVMMRYIMYYTEPGDIIFDGFSGSGMTGLATGFLEKPLLDDKIKVENDLKLLKCDIKWGKRHSICSDLSISASYLSSKFGQPFDKNISNVKLQNILKEVSEKYSNLYKTIVFKNTNKSNNITKFENCLIKNIEKVKNHQELNNILDLNNLKEISESYELIFNKDLFYCDVNFFVWSDIYNCNSCNSEVEYFDNSLDSTKTKNLNKITCPKCGNVFNKNTENKYFETVYDSIDNNTRKIAKRSLIKVSYNNKVLGRAFKKAELIDKIIAKKINELEIENNYPKTKLHLGYNTSQPINSHGIKYVCDFYTKRNLLIISELWNKLESENWFLITSGVTRNLMQTNRFVYDRGTWTIGRPLSGTLYMPSESVEQNPFDFYKSKLPKVEWKISKQSNQVGSSTDLKTIESNSIDYIFIDPPFGANIMYSDLNIILEGWLGALTSTNDEAIQNEFQSKGVFQYNSLMLKCFSEFFRILKPGKWMTVEFSNTNASIWNGIQTSLQNSGFVVSSVMALDKKHGTIRAKNTPTAVKQDLIISCYKPSSVFDIKFKQNQNTDVAVWDFVEEHLHHLPVHLVVGNSTTAIVERSPKILFDRLIAFYIQKGLSVPIDAAKFQQGLRENFIERDGMFFTNEQVQEYDMKKKEVPNFVQLSILVSSEQDGVLWLKNFLQQLPLGYQDIQPQWMQALAGVRKGDVIPELAIILEENFLKDEHGKWYVPDPENEIDLEKLRSKRLLKQFETYKIEVLKPKVKLKEVRVEALRAGFKQCYQDKDFKSIVTIGDRIPNNLLMEDEVLLQFYDIASSRV